MIRALRNLNPNVLWWCGISAWGLFVWVMLFAAHAATTPQVDHEQQAHLLRLEVDEHRRSLIELGDHAERNGGRLDPVHFTYLLEVRNRAQARIAKEQKD